MVDLNACYRLLELKNGATLAEINQAYKRLALVWHPDRQPQDDASRQQEAQEKLKQLNQARDHLRSYLNGHGQSQIPTPERRSHHEPRPHHSGANGNPQRNNTSHGTGQHSGGGRSGASWYETRQSSYYQAKSQNRSQNFWQNSSGDRTHNSSQSGFANDFASNPSQSQVPSPHHKPSNGGDLSGADFRGANLRERNLERRNLSHANLMEADLTDAFLHHTNLSGANLSRAKLFRANLFQANLAGADLREANLVGADFSGADLRGANLSGARVGAGGKILVKLTGALLDGAIMPDGVAYSRG